MSKEGVSIVICCYNSASRLEETLKYISLQSVPLDIPWEVIIVDNQSKDNTRQIATKFKQEFFLGKEFKITYEDRQGLTWAKVKGIEEAKYEFILFCDDDNWLCDSYVFTAFDVMSRNEEIGVLGGLGLPYWEILPSEWIMSYSGCFATGPQSEKSGEITYSNHVYGAGSIFRKSVLNKIREKGFRSILSGRLGDKLSSGEDHELCYAITLSGYKIWYDSRLKFQHFIPASRANKNYLIKLFRGFARCEIILSIYKIKIKNEKSVDFMRKSNWFRLILSYCYYLIKTSFRDLKLILIKEGYVIELLNYKYYFLFELIKSKSKICLSRKSINRLWNKEF